MFESVTNAARNVVKRTKLYYQGFVDQRKNNIRAASSCNTSAPCNGFFRARQPIYWAIEGERPADTLSRELDQIWAWYELKRRYPKTKANPWNFSEIIVMAINKIQKKVIVKRKVSSLSAMRKDLENNVICIGGVFAGLRHIICIYDIEGANFICDDSWGNALTGYKDHSGEAVLYPIEYVNKATFNGATHPYILIPRI